MALWKFQDWHSNTRESFYVNIYMCVGLEELPHFTGGDLNYFTFCKPQYLHPKDCYTLDMSYIWRKQHMPIFVVVFLQSSPLISSSVVDHRSKSGQTWNLYSNICLFLSFIPMSMLISLPRRVGGDVACVGFTVAMATYNLIYLVHLSCSTDLWLSPMIWKRHQAENQRINVFLYPICFCLVLVK